MIIRIMIDKENGKDDDDKMYTPLDHLNSIRMYSPRIRHNGINMGNLPRTQHSYSIAREAVN